MKSWLILGSIIMALAVIAGAFGAHGLKAKITPDDLKTYEKAVQYQGYHAIGLMIIGILGFHISKDLLGLPAMFFVIGIAFFSGSLYLLVLTDMRWLGVITPIGGAAFILGWSLLAWNLLTG